MFLGLNPTSWADLGQERRALPRPGRSGWAGAPPRRWREQVLVFLGKDPGSFFLSDLRTPKFMLQVTRSAACYRKKEKI